MNLSSFFKDKNVVITGHTGFKGSWLSQILSQLGANIYAFSLDIPTNPAHYELLGVKFSRDERIDLADNSKVSNFILESQPDFVFHLAAQPLVLESYKNEYRTYLSNSFGTMNILESLKQYNQDCIAIIITSDKCYENTDKEVSYKESDRLGGKDPYSTSKACAELITRGYSNSFFCSEKSNIRVATTRAGNVIGGGDWAKNRIVPDCFKSWSIDEVVKIRSPEATRPWQHVLDPINGYLNLACKMTEDINLNGESFNFGPESSYSVAELVKKLSDNFTNSEWVIEKLADSPYEAKLLSLDCTKSSDLLNFSQKLDFDKMTQWTSNWYESYYKNNEQNLTIKQIEDYLNLNDK